MIVKDNLPLRTSEKEGFRYFMKKVVPLYEPPRRMKVTTLLDEKYEVLFPIMKQKIQKIYYLALTADLWTESLNTTSIL